MELQERLAFAMYARWVYTRILEDHVSNWAEASDIFDGLPEGPSTVLQGHVNEFNGRLREQWACPFLEDL